MQFGVFTEILLAKHLLRSPLEISSVHLLLQNELVGSSCSLRDFQESSPIPQFTSINLLALSFLHSPTLTSIHDYWKNHSILQLFKSPDPTRPWIYPYPSPVLPSYCRRNNLCRPSCLASKSLPGFGPWTALWKLDSKGYRENPRDAPLPLPLVVTLEASASPLWPHLL